MPVHSLYQAVEIYNVGKGQEIVLKNASVDEHDVAAAEGTSAALTSVVVAEGK